MVDITTGRELDGGRSLVLYYFIVKPKPRAEGVANPRAIRVQKGVVDSDADYTLGYNANLAIGEISPWAKVFLCKNSSTRSGGRSTSKR
ncbi:hypothetical protein BHE74_00048872 [Ensete ventricosum]|nr:hypothetical protein BHE74_00048872 [Ensete ventricosum]